MFYLSFIKQSLSTKNSLEKAIAGFLSTQNRQIISAAEKEDFKKSITAEIEKLCLKNKRCKPVKTTWRSGASWNKTDKDEYLEGAHFVTFVLHAANMKTPPAPVAEQKQKAATEQVNKFVRTVAQPAPSPFDV